MSKKLLPLSIFVLLIMTPAGVSSGESDNCGNCYWEIQNVSSKPQGMESDVCYRCHDRVDEKRWAHGPIGVGQCMVCHDEPHESGSLAALTRESDKLCFYCHDENRLQQHISRVNSRDCVSCHDPHSGEDNLLLRQ